MTWHLRDEPDAIGAAALIEQTTGVPAVHVEKDFWVAEFLRAAVAKAADDGITLVYQQPRPMATSDGTSQFECRSREQTDWIRNHARLASTSGTAQVQVITPESSVEVVAYYAWCIMRPTSRNYHFRTGRHGKPKRNFMYHDVI